MVETMVDESLVVSDQNRMMFNFSTSQLLVKFRDKQQTHFINAVKQKNIWFPLVVVGKPLNKMTRSSRMVKTKIRTT